MRRRAVQPLARPYIMTSTLIALTDKSGHLLVAIES